MTEPKQAGNFFTRGSWDNTRVVIDILRLETVGGALLLLGAAAGIIWANTPWSEQYFNLRDLKIGSDAVLHLNLSIGKWAADGLLAIFFFVAGLELKREFVAGELRDPRKAIVPVSAAVCGVIVPAVVYLAVTELKPEFAGGWAIPAATDIAFALAVLAVIGTHLPNALRAFLLTLAVVDDLIAIIIIAVAYTEKLNLTYLLAGLACVVVFAVLTHANFTNVWLLLPIAIVTWALVHESGIHATIAGVALGLAVPVRPSTGRTKRPRTEPLAEQFEHLVRPLSAGVAVPVFAFFSAGVTIVGDGFAKAMANPVVWGIVAGLVLGKVVGVLVGTFLSVKILPGDLDDDLDWWDMLGVSLLAGIGFTVSLLITELAFPEGSINIEHGRVGVLLGSLIAAALASVVLVARNRKYRRIHDEETRDDDADGIPDAYETDSDR